MKPADKRRTTARTSTNKLRMGHVRTIIAWDKNEKSDFLLQ
jgi:hypothetical protein